MKEENSSIAWNISTCGEFGSKVLKPPEAGYSIMLVYGLVRIYHYNSPVDIPKSIANTLKMTLLCHKIWHRHICNPLGRHRKQIEALTIMASEILWVIVPEIPSINEILYTYVLRLVIIAKGLLLLRTNAALVWTHSPAKQMMIDIHRKSRISAYSNFPLLQWSLAGIVRLRFHLDPEKSCCTYTQFAKQVKYRFLSQLLALKRQTHVEISTLTTSEPCNNDGIERWVYDITDYRKGDSVWVWHDDKYGEAFDRR